ncbi:MAG: pyrroline-5-carboxylate reductase [Acidobacteriota bacterium]|nr:pyrroline-5-carboxylate reductase [Acidobacteriota bacterium]
MAYELIIVGGGRMGSALAEGLLAVSWCAPADLLIVETAREQRDALVARLPEVDVVASLELDAVAEKTGALLCVKPEYAEAVASHLATVGVSRVLSVVAGLSSARIENAFRVPVAVVRAMPNTPVLVGKGASAIAGGSHVTSDDLAWAESILGAVGVVVRVSERNIDAVTGLSGPMPAYLYLVVEALIESGVHQGLSREVSRALVVATFEGSAALLASSGATPEELRAQVTSPGGTTAAGLRALESRAVRAAFLEAVAAAASRSAGRSRRRWRTEQTRRYPAWRC